MNLKDMKIGTRLGLGFGVIIILLITLAVVGVMNLKNISTSLDRIVRVNNALTNSAQMAAREILAIDRALITMISAQDSDTKAEEKQTIEKMRVAYNEDINNIQKLEQSDKGKSILANVIETTAKAKEVNDRVITSPGTRGPR